MPPPPTFSPRRSSWRPAFATAWFALGAIRDRLGDREGAIAAFGQARDADPDDYHGARLQLARLGAGDAAPAMTRTYVRRLFDQYAERYDAALTEHLAYRGPALLREAVETVMRAAGRPLRFGSMLDLGCGTGLAGAAFRPFVDRLVGVDLSPAMIAQAAAKGIYDRLVAADLRRSCRRDAPTARNIDLVLAADVFVYVNDLAPIVAAVARVLAPDGLVAFTVETHPGDGVKLLPTLRYAHGEVISAPRCRRRACDRRISPRPRCATKRRSGRRPRRRRATLVPRRGARLVLARDRS